MASKLWRALGDRELERAIVEDICRGHGAIERHGDVVSIRKLTETLCFDPTFHDEAPPGFAAGGQLYTVVDGGQLAVTPLSLDHHQITELAWSPDPTLEPVLFDTLVDQALAGDDAKAQRRMLLECLGAGLLGIMPRLQLATLLYGPPRSGKSALLSIVQALYPAGAVSALSPPSWGHPYYRAGLAGKRANLCAELDDGDLIPGPWFKAVIAGDPIEARNPNHRPFSFRPRAAHLFATNRLPGSTDRTAAFFRRWRVIRFRNSCPEHTADASLVDRIIEGEMPGVLHLLIDAGRQAAATGRIEPTRTHQLVLAEWQQGIDPVSEWLLDVDAVNLTSDLTGEGLRGQECYDAFRTWCGPAGHRHPPGRNRFYRQLAEVGTARGISIDDEGPGNSKRVLGMQLRTGPTGQCK
jgi:putative DNA primase/helicase